MNREVSQEPIDICDRTFDFAVRIVNLCRSFGGMAGVCRPLVSQLLRSGTSIGANVSEAQAAQSRPDFISKMNIALKEARETHWLRLLVSSDILSQEQLVSITQEAKEISLILGAIVRSARQGQKS